MEMDFKVRMQSAVNGLSTTLIASAMALPQAHAEPVTFELGGFIKLDALSSAYDDGDLPAGSIGRDFYLPGLIPVDGESEGRDTDFHAKSTRLNLTVTSDIDGRELRGFVETDFMVGPEGDERVSNSYQPRLRQAYASWGNWLFGQTWTTFQDVSALPETLDFIGPVEGTVFVRQAQVRYSRGNWQLALENPETTITPSGEASRISADDGSLPDAVLRYSVANGWYSWSVAGLLRELAYEEPELAVDDTTTGFGVTFSAKLTLGARNDLRFMITAGKGLGRYLGVNLVNGAALEANGKLEAVESASGMISYRHFWSDKWRSNLSLASFKADHSVAPISGDLTEAARSIHVNLLHSPVESFTIGAELIAAERDLENGRSGSMNRVQFSAKYEF